MTERATGYVDVDVEVPQRLQVVFLDTLELAAGSAYRVRDHADSASFSPGALVISAHPFGTVCLTDGSKTCHHIDAVHKATRAAMALQAAQN